MPRTRSTRMAAASIATGKGDGVHAGYTSLFRQVLKRDAAALDAIGSFLTYGVGASLDSSPLKKQQVRRVRRKR